MPSINIQYFTPTAAAGTSAGPASAAVALPDNSANLLRIANLGPCHVAFLLGTTNAVACTSSTGTVVMAGRELIVGAQGMSYVALVSAGGPGTSSTCNLSSGN